MKTFTQYLKEIKLFNNLMDDQDFYESMIFDATLFESKKSKSKKSKSKELDFDPVRAANTPHGSHDGDKLNFWEVKAMFHPDRNKYLRLSNYPGYTYEHNYDGTLSNNMKALIHHPSLSKNIDQNLVDQVRGANAVRVHSMQQSSREPGFHDFGWKLHLNAPNTKHHKEISNFLKKHDIPHKFGYYGPGKDFTVYTGSKHATHNVANLIQKHIPHLLKPNHKKL